MKKGTIQWLLFFGIMAGANLGAAQAAAEDFHCEVLSLTGSASVTDVDGKVRVLQEGDLIAKDETVATAADSVMDLAFDSEWKNVTRLEEKSKLKVTSVYPGKLELGTGAVFAKLKSLPKNSAFQIKTPTAVATVRGTEYRTTFIGGQTEVFNVSSSKVFVYGLNSDGSADNSQEVVLEQSKKTQVMEAGESPAAPQDLTPEEAQVTEEIKTIIETTIQEVQTTGRKSNIQTVADMESHAAAEAEALKNKAAANLVEPNDSDESRVVDLRRRPFKKVE